MDNVPCTYRISLKAAIKDNDGRILLLREKNGDWELPGGGMEHGETVKDALAREIAEETGMKLKSIDEKPEAFWTIQKEVGSPTLKWFAFLVYAVRASGTFRPDITSDEAEEAQYFTMEEARALQLHDNTKPYFGQ